MITLIMDTLIKWGVEMANDLFTLFQDFDLLSAIFGNFSNPTGMQQYAIPYFTAFVKVAEVLGWILFIFIAYYQVIKAIATTSNGRGKNPFTVIVRLAFVALLLVFRPNIMTLFQALANVFYTVLSKVGLNIPTSNLALTWYTYLLDYTSYMTRATLVGAITVSMTAAAIGMLERFVSLALYLYVYPIAVALSADSSTSDCAINWAKGAISQLIAIILSYTLLHGAMYMVCSAFSESGRSNVVALMMGVVLLGCVKNFEKFLNVLNIKTMQNADSARAMVSGAFQSGQLFRKAAGITMQAVRAGGWAYGTIKGKPASSYTPMLGNNQNGGVAKGGKGAVGTLPQSKNGMLNEIGERIANNSKPVKASGKGLQITPDKKFDTNGLKKQTDAQKITGVQKQNATVFDRFQANQNDRKVMPEIAKGYDRRMGEIQSAQQKYNDFVGAKGENGNRLSTKETSDALHMEQRIGGFKPNEDGNAQFLKSDKNNYGTLISGTKTRADGATQDVSYIVGKKNMDIDSQGKINNENGKTLFNTTGNKYALDGNGELYAYEVTPAKVDLNAPVGSNRSKGKISEEQKHDRQQVALEQTRLLRETGRDYLPEGFNSRTVNPDPVNTSSQSMPENVSNVGNSMEHPTQRSASQLHEEIGSKFREEYPDIQSNTVLNEEIPNFKANVEVPTVNAGVETPIVEASVVQPTATPEHVTEVSNTENHAEVKETHESSTHERVMSDLDDFNQNVDDDFDNNDSSGNEIPDDYSMDDSLDNDQENLERLQMLEAFSDSNEDSDV